MLFSTKIVIRIWFQTLFQSRRSGTESALQERMKNIFFISKGKFIKNLANLNGYLSIAVIKTSLQDVKIDDNQLIRPSVLI